MDTEKQCGEAGRRGGAVLMCNNTQPTDVAWLKCQAGSEKHHWNKRLKFRKGIKMTRFHPITPSTSLFGNFLQKEMLLLELKQIEIGQHLRKSSDFWRYGEWANRATNMHYLSRKGKRVLEGSSEVGKADIPVTGKGVKVHILMGYFHASSWKIRWLHRTTYLIIEDPVIVSAWRQHLEKSECFPTGELDMLYGLVGAAHLNITCNCKPKVFHHDAQL